MNCGIGVGLCDVELKLSASPKSFSVKWGYYLSSFPLRKVVKLQRDDACESKLRMTRDCAHTHKLLFLLIISLISIFYSSQRFRILPSVLFDGNAASRFRLFSFLFLPHKVVRGFLQGWVLCLLHSFLTNVPLGPQCLSECIMFYLLA